MGKCCEDTEGYPSSEGGGNQEVLARLGGVEEGLGEGKRTIRAGQKSVEGRADLVAEAPAWKEFGVHADKSVTTCLGHSV